MKLLENAVQFAEKMAQAMLKQLNRTFSKRTKVIETRLREFTIDYLRTTDTYQSLIGGGDKTLAGHFGFHLGTGIHRIETILKVLSDNLDADFKQFTLFGGLNISGGFAVSIKASVIDELIALNVSTVETEKQQQLPWLSWLLKEGDRYIITDYHIAFKAAGRSGEAVMVRKGQWQVPPPYAGVEDNNWLTQALNDFNAYQQGVARIIEQEIA